MTIYLIIQALKFHLIVNNCGYRWVCTTLFYLRCLIWDLGGLTAIAEFKFERGWDHRNSHKQILCELFLQILWFKNWDSLNSTNNKQRQGIQEVAGVWTGEDVWLPSFSSLSDYLNNLILADSADRDITQLRSGVSDSSPLWLIPPVQVYSPSTLLSRRTVQLNHFRSSRRKWRHVGNLPTSAPSYKYTTHCFIAPGLVVIKLQIALNDICQVESAANLHTTRWRLEIMAVTL